MKKAYKNFAKNLKKGENLHLAALLLLFVGFASFALGSFFFSTNRYLNSYQASVLGSWAGEVEETDLVAMDDLMTEQAEMTGSAIVEMEEYEVFSDVKSTDLFAEAIEALRDEGVISGYEDGSFKPNNRINRAELMAILTDAVDADFAGKSFGNCFSDVTDQWFAVAVCFAKEEGWTSGYEDGSFKPGQNVVRAEAVKIILQSLEFKIPESISNRPFEDVFVTSWFAPYAQVAKKEGILTSNTFEAEREMTRGEVAQVLYNAMKAKKLF